MLSILIPIYNQDVNRLVEELADQCNRAGLVFEILAFDDASKERYKSVNRGIDHIFGVNYVESERNLGRSAMRNRLARTASMEYLLFLDCDVKIPNRSFIKKYAEGIRAGYPVANGGISYSKRKPGKNKRLHWTYGTKREALPAAKRRRKSYSHIMTGNLLIRKDLFLRLPLDESLSGYGHEDTLFGMILKNEDIPVYQIDNPVQHLGLETSTVFLKKQDAALDNLLRIIKKYPDFSTRLTRSYDQIMRSIWGGWLMSFIAGRMERIQDNLLGPKPSIHNLDLYKLYGWHKRITEFDAS